MIDHEKYLELKALDIKYVAHVIDRIVKDKANSPTIEMVEDIRYNLTTLKIFIQNMENAMNYTEALIKRAPA